ncbi:MAG: hypothetical protein WAU58_19745 [Terriglobales bacterium]
MSEQGRSWAVGARQREMEAVHVREDQRLSDVVSVLRPPVQRAGDGTARYYFTQLELDAAVGCGKCAGCVGCEKLGPYRVEWVRSILAGLPDNEVDTLLIPKF